MTFSEWKKAVFQKDDHTCQICGCKRKRLEAHYVESYESFPKLRVSVSNGVTLCENCHENFHHNFGHGNNTKDQFKQFRVLYCEKCDYDFHYKSNYGSGGADENS